MLFLFQFVLLFGAGARDVLLPAGAGSDTFFS